MFDVGCSIRSPEFVEGGKEWLGFRQRDQGNVLAADSSFFELALYREGMGADLPAARTIKGLLAGLRAGIQSFVVKHAVFNHGHMKVVESIFFGGQSYQLGIAFANFPSG